MALYAPVGGRAPTDQALPWCPVRLSPHAIPATPEGSPAPGSCAGSGDTGLPPNVHGVGAPNDVTRLRLGSLHATACGVACSPVIGGRCFRNYFRTSFDLRCYASLASMPPA